VSFAELALTGPGTGRTGPSCTVGIFLESLPAVEEEGLGAMLASDSGWQSEAIAKEIQAVGTRITGTTVARHRRGGCSCELR
jgi:hypothetical protein